MPLLGSPKMTKKCIFKNKVQSDFFKRDRNREYICCIDTPNNFSNLIAINNTPTEYKNPDSINEIIESLIKNSLI